MITTLIICITITVNFFMMLATIILYQIVFLHYKVKHEKFLYCENEKEEIVLSPEEIDMATSKISY